MTDYREWTVDDLQDELRDRDLKVSGTKDELVDRLEEADEDREDAEDGEDRAGGNGQRRGDRQGPSLPDLVRRIQEDLTQVVGLEPERLTGLEPSDRGWRAEIDVVEVRRVPPSTDVLATYEVTTDGDGNLGSVRRVRRFRRSEGDER